MDVKLVSLSVLPSQASMLCFEGAGIIGELNVELGSPGTNFDFPLFYSILGSMPTISDDPARLLYNFLEIQSYVGKYTLAALRAEASKAALSKAINLRANSFYAKYANAPELIAATRRAYDINLITSKPWLLLGLQKISAQQYQTIADAWTKQSDIRPYHDVVPRFTYSTVWNYNVPLFKIEDPSYEPGDMAGFSRQHTDTGTYRAPYLENAAQYLRQNIRPCGRIVASIAGWIPKSVFL